LAHITFLYEVTTAVSSIYSNLRVPWVQSITVDNFPPPLGKERVGVGILVMFICNSDPFAGLNFLYCWSGK